MKTGWMAWLAMLGVAACSKQPAAEVTWPSYNNDLAGQRFSSLQQIDAKNIDRLGEVCRVQIDGPGSFHAGMVVADGTLYTSTSTQTVALNATDCTLRWRYDHAADDASCGGSNRGMALLDGRVFRGTCDGWLIALDAATGKLLWKQQLAARELGEATVAVPLAHGGVVYMGIGGSDLGVRGRVVALDAASGKELWRFHTIPMGDETGAETWLKPETAKTGGGGVWGAMSLDAESGELFVPVGNPWPDIDKAYRPGDNLFTNSMVVLDAHTGELKWWHQIAPADWMDLDLSAAPMLYTRGDRKLVAIGGKDGFVTVVDRATHERVFRTAVTTVEPMPEHPPTEAVRMCPGFAGGVEWNGPALDKATGQIIVGSVDICFKVKLAPPEKYVGGALEFGGSVEPDGEPSGWITALDPVSGEVRWQHHAEKPVVAGITPTAAGITFAGDLAGNLMVFESASGKLLRQLPVRGAMAGGISTYTVAGRQYLAFNAGNISRNAFGDVGLPSVVIMTVDPPSPATALDITVRPADGAAPQGQRIYAQVCQSCHGPDGKQMADHSLAGLAAKRELADTIEYIKHPKAPMPVLYPQVLGEEDVVAVATWVHEELR